MDKKAEYWLAWKHKNTYYDSHQTERNFVIPKEEIWGNCLQGVKRNLMCLQKFPYILSKCYSSVYGR